MVAFLKRSEHFGVGLLRFRHAVVGDIGGFGEAHALDYLHFVVHRLHDVDIAVNRQSAHDDQANVGIDCVDDVAVRVRAEGVEHD